MLKLKSLNYKTGTVLEEQLAPAKTAHCEWMIGRSVNCDLVLASPEVSRVHGRIEYDRGQYYFSDLGSTDGSCLNQKPVEVNRRCVLKQDDLIRIGDFILAVDFDSTSDPAQPEQWTEDLTVRCVQIVEETADIKTFRFVATFLQPFFYQPGQFVCLQLEIDGKPVQRAYSISSSPARPHTLDITVKRVPPPADSPEAPPGLVSNWLHEHLTVGDEVQLNGGPLGQFTCGTTADKLLLISAGSGITPMLSTARWLYDTAQERDVIFFHSARSPHDIVARQELEFIAARQPQFRLALTVTRPGGQPWLGYTGRLTETMLLSLAPDLGDRTIYVCGPEPFMEGVKAMLSTLNFPMENYHEESFGRPSVLSSSHQPSAIASMATASSSEPAVVFSEAGQEFACGEGESILEVAQQNGIKIRSGCLQGVCGVCKQRKQEGEVRYAAEPSALSAEEQEAGYILPCVAFPVGRVVVQ